MRLLMEGRVKAIEEKERTAMDEICFAKLLDRTKEKERWETEGKKLFDGKDEKKLRARKIVEEIFSDKEKVKKGMREVKPIQSED